MLALTVHTPYHQRENIPSQKFIIRKQNLEVEISMHLQSMVCMRRILAFNSFCSHKQKWSGERICTLKQNS
jgi:hypothetical protein